MNARTHFVYRVFDAHGLLLYVGCTARPEARWKQHRASGSPWPKFADSFAMQGPYTSDVAFAIESSAIESEGPFFNALRQHRGRSTRRTALSRRLHEQLRAERPELYAIERFNEFSAAAQEIDDLIDAELPPFDAEWRLANYLSHRTRSEVSA